MQTISVRTTQNVFIHYPIASIGDRILAHLIDRIILVAYSFVMIILLIKLESESLWLGIILFALPWLFYNFLFEVFMNGQSPGKKVMNIQVVRLDGTQPSIGDYLLRWVFSLIEFYMLSGAIAVVVIAMGGKGQRLGDVVAGTSVVKLMAAQEISAGEIFIAPETEYAPRFPQVVQLNERDIELIQRALEANRDFGNDQPVMVVTEKIKSILGIQTDLPPLQFLYIIVKDFTHLSSR